MKPTKNKIENSLARLVGILLLTIGVLLFPSLYEKVFALDKLLVEDSKMLTIASVILIGTGCLYITIGKRISSKLGLILMGFSFLSFADLGFRLLVNLTFSEAVKYELELDRLRTFPDFTAYTGHPFLNFTKQPARLNSSKEEPNIFSYNKLGFNDIDRPYSKPAKTYRIAALGGSTTERGYPQILEQILDSSATINGNIEVLNFGIASWTTAHSLVNYFLNVVAFEPDMIIIHHGWNETQVRNINPEDFRPDYSHAFTYFHEPQRSDCHLIRLSLIYRFVKLKLGAKEDWMFLNRAVIKHDPTESEAQFNNHNELLPYRRNIKNIIDEALLANRKVVLTTMPYNNNLAENAMAGSAENIRQCNAITRALKADYRGQVILVDLDNLMTGMDNSHFVDLGHVTYDGKRAKSEHLARAIINELEAFETMLE